MPNIKSAKKRVKLSAIHNIRGREQRSLLRKSLKKFYAAAAGGDRSEVEGAYKVAIHLVDKAAARGILHKNNAARKKSALTLRLNALS